MTMIGVVDRVYVRGIYVKRGEEGGGEGVHLSS